MVNVSNLKWKMIIAITLQKIGFLSEKNSRPGIEPGTFQLWALSQDHYTKITCLKLGQRAMLYQVNMHFWHFAKSAGITNIQIFKSLRSARNSMLQVTSYMCSGLRGFESICGEFFSSFRWYFSFKIVKIASPIV